GAGVASEPLMLRALRLMKKNDTPAAREVMMKLDELYPDQPASERAAYLGSWIAMQAGDFEKAIEDFGRFDTRHKASKDRDDARWFKAYSEYRAGKCNVATLQSLIDDFPRSPLVPQALYWMTRCQQLQSPPVPQGKIVAQYK